MKKQLLFFVLILLPMIASAETVEINGIYYSLVSKTKEAKVTSNPSRYRGDITIPKSVKYERITYDVKAIGEFAFESCYDLNSVSIPNSVNIIESYAFSYCI